jgi:2-keto-4-pentenoate hydratase/2-oxohepta-3-ene-1,7-dioic acid hydratase in catechol pathway
MRIIRFVADDGRVLCGEDRGDGTAEVVEDRQGVLVATTASSRLARLRGQVAVVADDDENMRRLVCTVLEKAGCETRACADGAEAMSAVEQTRPDLVISDIMMPHHNGYEIYSAVKARYPDVPIVLITGFGYDPSHSLLRASQEGLQGVLYKPFTPQQLVEALLRAMEVGGEAGALQPTGEIASIASLLPPVRPGNIICIGRNYRGPNQPAASEPELDELEVFMKPTTALQASGEPIRLPDGGEDLQVDCEGELAVVIGQTAEHVAPGDAHEHVFGYTIANDITARRWQTAEGAPRWMRGKGFNTFCPLGPNLVTRDELDPDQALTITTLINGEVVREGSTTDMVRPVSRIISDLSRRLTLEAGTLVLTGAPPPLAAVRDHAFLKPGDEVAVEITGLGRLVNDVTAGG